MPQKYQQNIFFTPARKVPTAFQSSQTYLKECPFMLLSGCLGAFSQVIALGQRTTRRGTGEFNFREADYRLEDARLGEENVDKKSGRFSATLGGHSQTMSAVREGWVAEF